MKSPKKNKLAVKFPFSGAKQVAKKGTSGGGTPVNTPLSTGVAKKSTARKSTSSASSELKKYANLRLLIRER